MKEELLQRALAREKAARKEAERLLEKKSYELYLSSEKLKKLAASLEAQVEERTQELYRLNMALEKAGEGFAITDEKGDFIYMNQAHATLYGYDGVHELIGKNWSVLYDEIETNRLVGLIENKLMVNGYWSGEATASTKSGGTFPEVLALTLLPSGGILCRCSDDTDRQNFVRALQLQSSLRIALFENIEMGIFFEYLKGSSYFANKLFYKFFSGVPKLVDTRIKAHSLAKLISKHLKDGEKYIEFSLTLSQKKHKVTNTEWEMLDGRFINLDFLPVYAGDDYIGNLWTFRDCTQEKKHNLNLEIARAKAEEAAEAKSLFLANMSHEIRTPLNGIIGMNRLLMNEPLTSEQHDRVSTVQFSAESLLRIINDILDFSKIEARKMEFEIVEYSVVDILDAVADHFNVKAHNKKLEFNVIYDAHIPAVIYCDPMRIRQILLNLISNAVKFTTFGRVDLRAKLEAVAGDRCTLSFTIQDTGIGMSEKEVSRLFSSFSQANSMINKDYGGTGLGLAISKELTEAMGGDIDVQSVPGEGSMFSVRIRCKFRDKPETKKPSDFPLCECLVISNRSVNQDALVSMVELEGLQVQKASLSMCRSMEGLEQGISNKRLYVVNVDSLSIQEMPELIALIEGRKSQEAFILLSSSKRMVEDWLNENVIFLSMPISRKSLVYKVRKCLGYEEQSDSLKDDDDQNYFKNALSLDEPIRVLLAEDNSVNQQVLSLTLKGLGMVVDIAGNGIEAIRFLETIRYDLILMDIRMPEMDGIEACQVIRKMGLDTPIIAMTANAMIGDKEIYLEAGMNGYVSKPIMIDAIKQEVVRLLKDQPLVGENLAVSPPEAEQSDEVEIFNYDAFLMLVGGNVEIAKNIAIEFFHNSQNPLEEGQAAVSEGDYLRSAAAFHKLSGGAYSIRATEMGQISGDLEKELRQKVVSKVIVEEKILMLRGAYKRYELLLKEWGWI